HMRSFRDGWRNLRLMLLFCPLWLYFIPAGILSALGLFLMLWLTPAARHVGPVTLDVHTMLLGSLCLLLGYQTGWLGFLAKVYGHYSGVLPAGELVKRILATFTLERGLVVGLAISAVGLAANLWLTWEWSARDFGPLNISQTMRFALWGLTAMVTGA